MNYMFSLVSSSKGVQKKSALYNLTECLIKIEESLKFIDKETSYALFGPLSSIIEILDNIKKSEVANDRKKLIPEYRRFNEILDRLSRDIRNLPCMSNSEPATRANGDLDQRIEDEIASLLMELKRDAISRKPHPEARQNCVKEINGDLINTERQVLLRISKMEEWMTELEKSSTGVDKHFEEATIALSI